MKLIQTDSKLALIYKEKTVFTHTAATPFLSVLDMQLSYKSTHGNFKVKEKIAKRIPLTEFKVQNYIEGKSAIFEFFKDDLRLRVSIKILNGYLQFEFSGTDRAVEICLNAVENEGIFGGGEQYRELNLKGEKVLNFVSEHIVVLPIVQKTVFSFLPYKEKPHSKIETYCPMSTFVSSDHYAVRFETESYGCQDFTNKTVSMFRYNSLPAKMIFVVEDSFKEIGKKLALDIENNEFLPDWCYDGMILGVQGGIDRAVEKTQKMLDAGAKICGVWCQDWSGKKVTVAGKQVYWNWEVDSNLYPDLKNRIAELNKTGVRFLGYINPYLVVQGKLYNYCKEKGYLIKNSKGEVYHIKSTTFSAGMMDLTNPDMVKFLKDVIIKQNMIDLGIDGYMADFGEYLPVDAVLFNGDAKTLHNEWPTLWAKINREAIKEAGKEQEVFFFTRSGYNGAQKYTNIMWNGDQHTDFTKDYGMPCVMPASFNLGFSGMTAVHSDVGGFISFGKLARDNEIFIRWMEMNAFSPLMRSHETIRPDFNAQFDNEVTTPYTVKLSKIHSALKPYLKECMKEANGGIPIMRPDFYNSNDFSKHKDLYCYLLGDDIFVAPVIEKGATTKKVNLPEGEWVHIFCGKKYSSGEYVVDASLGSPAVFYRANSKYADIFKSLKD